MARDESSKSSSSSAYLTMFGAHKVPESLARLPKWLQDYIAWHAEQRKKPVSECKFLIIPCLYGNKCGGTSDRLRPLPYWLLLAKLTERVLIIKWDKPHDLHHFLIPPPGGLDWRSFPEIDQRVIRGRNYRLQNKFEFVYAGKACGDDVPLVNCTIDYVVPNIKNQTNNPFVMVSMPGNQPYEATNDGNMFAQQFSYDNEMPIIGQWGYAEMFSDIFRVMFEPVPALAQQINQTMASLGLREGAYTSTHVRARYPAANTPLDRKSRHMMDKDGGHFEFTGDMMKYAMRLSNNAIDCGYSLAPDDDLPILFVSDSHLVANYWNSTRTKRVSKDVEVKVVAVNRSEEPLHIDRDDGWPGSTPIEFYSVFEDLLMMGGSKCVAHGIGSFGSFGAGLIGNKCRAIHRKHNGLAVKCPNSRTDRIMIPTDPMLMKLLMPEYVLQ